MKSVEAAEFKYEQARGKLGTAGAAAQGHENAYTEAYQTLVKLGARPQLRKKYR